MEPKPSTAKKLSIAGLNEIASEFAKQGLSYAWPFVAAAVTAPLGYIQGLPWMYIWVASGLMFAATAHGLQQFALLRDRTKIKDNLNFAQIRIGRNIHGEGMFLGVLFVNQANSPIEFDVQEANTRLNDKFLPRKPFDRKSFTVPAKGFGWFDDHIIDIGVPPKSGTIEGFAEFKVKYGRPGALKYELSVKKQVVVSFNADGLFEHGSWNDAA